MKRFKKNLSCHVPVPLKTRNFPIAPILRDASKVFQVFAGKARTLMRLHRDRNLIKTGWNSLKKNGLRYTLREATNKFNRIGQPLFSAKELEEQKTARFRKDIRYSILVPIPFLKANYFQEMLRSVLQQTYTNWELYLIAGNKETLNHMETIVFPNTDFLSRIHCCMNQADNHISPEKTIESMATGDYFVFLRQSDLLHPSALYEITRAICEKDADFIYTDENSFRFIPEDANQPRFKPSYAPDSLRGHNYIGYFIAVKRDLLGNDHVDDFADAPVSHDTIFRLTEKAQQIIHIPEILYYKRADVAPIGRYVPASEDEAIDIQAIERHLQRIGLKGEVFSVKPHQPFYHVKYELKTSPKVSILIPNYEHLSDLKLCLSSIFSKTTYPNFEIIIVENNSRSAELFDYYEAIQKEHNTVRVVTWEDDFNYSSINNFGAGYCTGDYILLLNNDTEVITPDWIQEMLMFGQRNDVGAVGVKLIYPDGTVQHGGVAIGIGGVAAHLHMHCDRDDPGYMGQLLYAQNLSAVTAACMLIRRDVWDQVNGLDESFAIAFNDIDLCMRIRQKGYLIVWTPFAELLHFESKSRGYEDTPEKKERFSSEIRRFQERWSKELADGDPYYNPNFSLDRESFTVKPIPSQNNAR